MFVARVVCCADRRADPSSRGPTDYIYICVCVCVCVCDQAVQRPLQLQRAGRRGQTDKERNKEHDVKLCSETEKCREKFVNNERLTVNKEMEYIYVYTYIYIYIFNVVLTVHRR